MKFNLFKSKSFRGIFNLETWHFVITIMLFYVVNAIIAEIKVRQMPLTSGQSSLRQLDEIKFDDRELNFVFFYDSNSELSKKMRFNIEKLIENSPESEFFFAVDVNQNPKLFFDLNVSGTPNILVFKGGEEVNRIMGVMSYKHLKRVVQKLKENQ